MAFKERSEQAFDQQTGYRRKLAESFRYSEHDEQRDDPREGFYDVGIARSAAGRQLQLAAGLRRVEELRVE